MQSLEHLLSAVGLYILYPVLPISYQYGTPISIVPLPLGDIVVTGVNLTIKVLEEVWTPSVFELDVKLTFSGGVIAC